MSPPRVEHLPGISLPLARVGVHECPYLPDRLASELIAVEPVTRGDTYQLLMDHRFRRSGPIFYRPDCPTCQACVPIRVPVDQFEPSRSQRRVLRRNQDLTVETAPIQSDDERYDLYTHYQLAIHAGGMLSTREDFDRFFCYSPIETIEMTFRAAGRLIGLGILDVCPTSLSSVYFYYDPAESKRSLGIFSALSEIAECRRRHRPHWYLGFHVAGCRKMEYKTQFRPHELLTPAGEWVT